MIMTDLIKLWRTDDPKIFTEGDFASDGNGIQWVRTTYSDHPCSRRCEDVDCPEAHYEACRGCGGTIMETEYVRGADGESAHEDCVVIHSDYPHQTDTLYDCPACDMDEDHDR